MAFDAGQIQASLDLDINPFRRALDEARAQAREFAAGDTTATLGASADTAGASAELDRLKAKADELKGTRIDIQATADTARAQAELEALKLKADQASGAAGGAGAGGGISGLLAGGLALGPALLPVLGAAAVGVGGLASVLGVATVGLGSFAALAIPSFQGVGKEVQTITKDQDALNAAVTQKDKLQALQQLQQDFAKIPPEQRLVVQGILDFKQALDNVSKSIQPQIFGAFQSFLNAGKTLLPQLAGPAKQAALALSDIGDALNRAFQSQGFHAFMGWITGQTRGAIDAIATAVGNIAKGFGFLLEDFAPLVPAIEGGMKRITGAFATWAQNLGGSQGFQTFLQWVHDNARPVGDALKNIADSLIGIVRASAGLGGIEIRALADLAGALNALVKVPVLGPIVADIALLALAVGKLSQIGFVAAGLSKFAEALKGLLFASGAKAALAGLPEEIAATGAASEVASGRVFGFAGGAKGAASEAEGLGSKAAGATGLLGGLGGASEGLVGALIPLAPALIAVAGGAGLVALAVQGLHNNYSGMVQVVSTGQPILSDAGVKIDEARAAVKRLNDEAANAGPAFKGLVGQIDQALGNLAPDLANKGIQAEQALAEAIKNGQAPNMASIDADNILKAYNQLLAIPGIGAQVMGALSTTIDSHGKQLGQVVLDQVHNLVGEYGQLAPNVQQQVLKAMSDLQAGLATGNQGMINNAKAQLALLSGAYGQAGANIVQTGNAAFGQLVTDVEAHTSQMNVTAQASVAFLKGLYNTLPAPVQQAANLAMQDLDNALKSGNQAAIDTASNAVNLVLVNYAKLPPDVQTQVSQAMTNLNTALASGNQAAIDDATHKLGDLVNRYQGTVQPIGQAGTDAGNSFGTGINQTMRDHLAALGVTMSAYDATIQGGVNPILSTVGGQQVNLSPQQSHDIIGLPGKAMGGIVTQPGLFMAGEGGYPETIISHDPRQRSSQLDYWAQTGKILGVPGFQQGGFMDPSQVPAPPDATFFAQGGSGLTFGGGTDGIAHIVFDATKAFVATQAAARAAAAVSSAGGSPFGGGPIKAYMLGEVAKRWPGDAEASAFDYVEMREAGYNPNAQNPTSSAAGLAQNISGFGPGYERGNVQQQTAWMLNYIAGRYGDPIGAAAHERAFNWYGGGGIFTSPTVIGVGDKGPEAVVPLGRGGAFGGTTVNVTIGTVTQEAMPQLEAALTRLGHQLTARGIQPQPGGVMR